MLRIGLPGVMIWGAPYEPLARGLYVLPGGFKGWDGSPSGRREAVARPFAHGEFDLPVFRSPRVVTISGVAVAGSTYELRQLSEALTALGADGEMLPLVVDHEGQELKAYARVIEVTFTDEGKRGARQRAKFSVNLVCPDPRKYGVTNVYSGDGSVLVWQRGNFPGLPQIRVSGASSSGYTVTGPGGKKIVVSRALASGSPHTLDLATGALLVGGSRVLGGVASYQEFTIPPKKKATVSVSSDLALQVTVPDTYM